MNFIEALHHARDGKTIVSALGYKYELQDIAPLSLGSHWAIFSTPKSMTKWERENSWTVERG